MLCQALNKQQTVSPKISFLSTTIYLQLLSISLSCKSFRFQLRVCSRCISCKATMQASAQLHNGAKRMALSTGLQRQPFSSGIRPTRPRRLLRSNFSSSTAVRATPQPLADVAVRGIGRLTSKAVESITNPKEQKQKQEEWQRQQDQEKQRREQEQREQQELQEQLAAQEAAEAAVDHIEAAASNLQEAAHTAAEDAIVAVPEAVAAALTAQQIQEVTEYTEEEAAPKTIQQRYNDTVHFLTSSATGKGISIAAGLFLGATFLIALYRTYQKYSSPRAQRKRVIDRNKQLVEELSKYLPDKRAELTPAVLRKLRSSTGFTPVEVFRKYLWFLLRERKFDHAAVEDMVLLKTSLGLTDEQVAEALKERAQRTYDKYGTLMLNVDGMTAEGVERKATCRALFSKLLYLTEHEPLVAQGSEAFKTTDLRMVFGATDEDVEKLRIVSLYDVDIERMESLMNGDAAAEQQQGGQADKDSK